MAHIHSVLSLPQSVYVGTFIESVVSELQYIPVIHMNHRNKVQNVSCPLLLRWGKAMFVIRFKRSSYQLVGLFIGFKRPFTTGGMRMHTHRIKWERRHSLVFISCDYQLSHFASNPRAVFARLPRDKRGSVCADTHMTFVSLTYKKMDNFFFLISEIAGYL